MANPGGSCLDQLLALLAIPVALLVMLLTLGGDILGLNPGIGEEFFEEFGEMPAEPATVFPPSTEVPLFTPTPTAAPSVGGEAGVGQFRGELVPGGGDVWTYEGVEGEVISIEVLADNPANNASQEERDAQGLLDTYVYVYRPDGSLLMEADDIERGVRTDTQIDELVLPETGTYSIEVRSWSNTAGGGYTLSIKSSANPEVQATEAVLEGTAEPEATVEPGATEEP